MRPGSGGQMILFPYAGDTRGGSVHSSFLLIDELLRRGRPLLLAFHGEGFARDSAIKRGFPHIDLGALGTRAEADRKDRFRLGNVSALIACRRAIVEHGATVVHVNDKRMLRTWCIPARMSSAALLTHWRGMYLPRGRSVDLGLRLTSRIICVSSYTHHLLPAWARGKSEVVYNPFKPILDAGQRDDARRRIRESAGIPADAAVIGFFGSLLNRKRPHMLLDILRRLKTTADGRPVWGILCGEIQEPRDEVYFRTVEAEDWRGRLVAAGYVDNIGEWMAASDVMIAPGIEEPFGRVGIEAQSVGLPVVVSSDAGLREVVEDGISGLVVDPDDFEAWVDSVRRVLDDVKLARKLSEEGQHAAARLTVASHADAIEAIYKRVLGFRSLSDVSA